MLIHWKSLITFGFVFWILLCLTDLFGRRSYKYAIEETDFDWNTYDVYYNKVSVVKFGWSLVIWNIVTLGFSLLVCHSTRILSWKLAKPCSSYLRILFGRSKSLVKPILSDTNDSQVLLTKIPIMVKGSTLRYSDSIIKIRPKVTSEGSCPNLLSKKPSSHNVALKAIQKCHTLYRNSLFTGETDENNAKFNKHLENQSMKLREELERVQVNALREHSVLSRKLETVTKEKKDLAKQLTFVQKENRAARHQLEELLQEKGFLIKRLDNITKEFKANTKTKKNALTRLEEVTTHLENMKQQFEQVTRDKEILENKLKVLEEEYEKLQGRLRTAHVGFYQEKAPVRDTNGRPETNVDHQNQTDPEDPDIQNNKASLMTSSPSQTEIDMKKIEIKIKQLERNLENFNSSRTEMNLRGAEGESEISLSLQGNNTDTPPKTEEDTESSDLLLSSYKDSTLKYWGNKAGDMLHAFAYKVNDKIRLLDNISEKGTVEDDHDDDEQNLENYSDDLNDDFNPPKRIVSSSLAFQKFLKNLHPLENQKQFKSECDVRF